MKVRNKTGQSLSMEWLEPYAGGGDVTSSMDGNVYLSIWNEQMELTPTEALAIAHDLDRVAKFARKTAAA